MKSPRFPGQLVYKQNLAIDLSFSGGTTTIRKVPWFAYKQKPDGHLSFTGGSGSATAAK